MGWNYALRSLRATPGFSVVAVLSLAASIGASTTVFSIVNALLLKPLPVEGASELVSIYRSRAGQAWLSLSGVEFAALEARSKHLAGVTAFTVPGLQLSVRRPGERARSISGALVTTNHFAVLGVRAERGRVFSGEDGAAGSVPVVVSADFAAEWRLSPGDALIVNGQPAHVVGVMPASFHGTFTAIAVNVWVPLSTQVRVLPGVESLDNPNARFLNVIGRLSAQSTQSDLQAELAALSGGLRVGDTERSSDFGFTLASTTGVPPFIRQFILPFLILLFAIVAMVLAVACGNLAGLLLARTAARSREIAISNTLGATRARLVRQFLMEAGLIALAGAVLGTGLARLAGVALVSGLPNLGLPVRFDLALDLRVGLFALGCGVVTLLMFGLMPILHATRGDLLEPLRAGSATWGIGRRRMATTLLVVQIAFSVVLLSAMMLVFRGLNAARGFELGFQPRGVVLLDFDPSMAAYSAEQRGTLYRNLLQRVNAAPQITRAALAAYAPLGSRGDQLRLALNGSDSTAIGYNAVSPGFLQVIGVPLTAGRDIDESGRAEVIINEEAANRYWRGTSALDATVRIRGVAYRVVGIARNAKYGSIGEPPRPFVYVPLSRIAQVRAGFSGNVVLHARVRGAEAAALPVLVNALAELDPNVPATTARLADDIRFSLVPAKVLARVAGACGMLALLLGLIGLHAVAAQDVGRRNREFGIRRAVGARTSDILRLVTRQGVFVVAIGLVIGIPMSIVAGGLLRGLLYGVPAHDPVTYALVLALVLCALVSAVWLPARRALRSDPLRALKTL